VPNLQTVAFISTDSHQRISVTYVQLQIQLLVCFYTVVEVKWLPIINSKLLSKNTCKHTANANELGTYAVPGWWQFRVCSM